MNLVLGEEEWSSLAFPTHSTIPQELLLALGYASEESRKKVFAANLSLRLGPNAKTAEKIIEAVEKGGITSLPKPVLSSMYLLSQEMLAPLRNVKRYFVAFRPPLDFSWKRKGAGFGFYHGLFPSALVLARASSESQAYSEWHTTLSSALDVRVVDKNDVSLRKLVEDVLDAYIYPPGVSVALLEFRLAVFRLNQIVAGPFTGFSSNSVVVSGRPVLTMDVSGITAWLGSGPPLQDYVDAVADLFSHGRYYESSTLPSILQDVALRKNEYRSYVHSRVKGFLDLTDYVLAGDSDDFPDNVVDRIREYLESLTLSKHARPSSSLSAVAAADLFGEKIEKLLPNYEVSPLIKGNPMVIGAQVPCTEEVREHVHKWSPHVSTAVIDDLNNEYPDLPRIAEKKDPAVIRSFRAGVMSAIGKSGWEGDIDEVDDYFQLGYVAGARLYQASREFLELANAEIKAHVWWPESWGRPPYLVLCDDAHDGVLLDPQRFVLVRGNADTLAIPLDRE
jgi:hypothetical protein